MGANLSLSVTNVALQPGHETTIEVTVTNTGNVVDAFALQVLGPAGEWSRCEPASVSIFPGQSVTASVTFAPPLLSSNPAGRLPFGVQAVSHEDPQGSAVEEGTLDLAGVSLAAAEMSPRTGKSRGRRASKHVVAIDNTGNAPATVRLVGIDETDQVDLEFESSQVDIPAGGASFVKVKARAAHPFWRGQAQLKTFGVEAYGPDDQPIRMNGTLLNEPRIPKWLPKLLLLLLVAIIALAIFWYGLFKPIIKDTATNAANNALVAAGIPVPSPAGKGAATGSGGGGKKSGGGGGAGTPTPAPAPPAGTPVPGATPGPPAPATPAALPFSNQLAIAHPSINVDATHQGNITDLIFGNPAGDKGQLVIRNGGNVLLTLGLQDFRDYDLHFVTPIIVPPNGSLSMQINCQNAAPLQCTATTLVVGTQQATS